MKSAWERYKDIRRRTLMHHTKYELIGIIMEMEKIIAKVSKKEEGELE